MRLAFCSAVSRWSSPEWFSPSLPSITRAASSTSGRAKKQILERQGEVLLLRGWKSLKSGARSPRV
jgi:hypothetical protein